ncbi:MAG: glutathione S-transferase family protein [Rhodobiaceae bacterium]|nr:glutathione S-transferase family protein [Rhodobiaceae bacterium]
MILFGNHASPFTRKCRVLAAELGIVDQIAFQDPGHLSPVEANRSLVKLNPLGKIPVLQLKDGCTLNDSRVICEYLNTVADGDLFPAETGRRWRALHLQALTDGLMDAALILRYELTFRDGEATWGSWIDRQLERIRASVECMNRDISTFCEHITIGEISAACALGYLDFRFTELMWRSDNPELASWFEMFSRRPSMTSTLPNPTQPNPTQPNPTQKIKG